MIYLVCIVHITDSEPDWVSIDNCKLHVDHKEKFLREKFKINLKNLFIYPIGLLLHIFRYIQVC